MTGAVATAGLALPVRTPFDAAGLLAWLAARALPGVEDSGPEHYARTLLLPGGPAWFEVRPAPDQVHLTARLTSPQDLPALVSRVRHLLDLDADPLAVDAALAGHPELAPSVAAVPGIRLPGTVDPHEMLVRAMAGQQVTVAAARTQLARLVAAAGSPTDPAIGGGLTRLFPTAGQVAAHGAGVLVGPAARTTALLSACAALADGSLQIAVDDDPDAQRARLLARRGIGPWTADYLAMRVLHAPDVLPTGDVALRTGARLLGLPAEAKALAAWGCTVAPWRSYAALHLWRASSAGRSP